MRHLILWIGVILILAACSTPKSAIRVESTTVNVSAEDSLEYSIETFDAKFESWYLLHNSPARYRAQSYYENWNRQYVSAWNGHSYSGYMSHFFEPIIGYDPTVDYGFELNHELFYYFQYVERVLKIEILPNSPKAGII